MSEDDLGKTDVHFFVRGTWIGCINHKFGGDVPHTFVWMSTLGLGKFQ